MNEFTRENFDETLGKKVDYIENIIKEYLPEIKGEQKIIFEAMHYSVLAGGKRIRPMLMMETYLLFGGKNIEWIHPFMAAIEMIHTYSLVHDDLPAMDNDEYRRGKETTHIKYGETIGILAGDGLLNYAFERAIKSYYNVPCKDQEIEYKDRVMNSLRILASKAGVHGMIGGQVIDTCVLEGITMDENKKEEILNKLKNMYNLKTSGLIQGSMMIGATLAGASRSQVSLIEEMASNIGLAFQIQDDVLDLTSTKQILGKPVHSDERNKKITYVTLLGLEKAKEEVKSFSEKSLNILAELGKRNLFLEELISKLINREM